MSFEVNVRDLTGDNLCISTAFAEKAGPPGLACMEIQGESEAYVILNREQLVTIRSAVDMILTSDEAVRAKTGPAFDPTLKSIKTPRQIIVGHLRIVKIYAKRTLA